MLKSKIRATSSEMDYEMQRTTLRKTSILFTICVCLLTASVFGQSKPAGEVDVTKCWSYAPDKTAGSSLAADGSRLYLGLSGAKVDALSLGGKKMWATELGGDISSNILPLESGLFLVTSTVATDPARPGDSVLRSLSHETGITNWTLKLPDAERYFLGGFNDAVIVVSRSGSIQSVDAKSGSIKWKREIAEGFVAEPAFGGGKVMVATTGKQIFGVAMASGEIDSMRKMAFGITAIGITPSAELIAGDERGNVNSPVNGTDKANWKFKSGGEISKILTANGHILVMSHDNFIYFLTSRYGAVAWKKRLAGRLSRVATLGDRYALISSSEDHGAVLADLANGKVSGQVKLGDEENLISDPVISNGLIFVLTNRAAYAFSLNGCPLNKDGGTGK